VVFLKYYTHIPSQVSQVYILSEPLIKGKAGNEVCPKLCWLIKMRRERRAGHGEGALASYTER
jgi:hypothetical protein